MQNVTDFCVLVLCSETSLNVFINSNSFLVESLESSVYKIVSSASRGSFTFFSPLWVPFIYLFILLIVLVRTASTMLNRLFSLDLGRSLFSFSLVSMMLFVGCHICPLLCWDTFLLYLLCWVFLFFIMNECWILLNASSASSLKWPYDFILYSVNVLYHICWFACVQPSLHPSDKSHLIVVCDSFNVLLNSVC